jgi:hypothetical protein
MDEMTLVNIVIQLAEKFPTLATIFMVVGALRLIFKPLSAIIEAVVQYTPYDSDDIAWEKVKNHKVYMFLAWFVDWSASIKLPVKK